MNIDELCLVALLLLGKICGSSSLSISPSDDGVNPARTRADDGCRLLNPKATVSLEQVNPMGGCTGKD